MKKYIIERMASFGDLALPIGKVPFLSPLHQVLFLCCSPSVPFMQVLTISDISLHLSSHQNRLDH